MKTVIRKLDPRERAALCGVVARLIPALTWRHAGLGALQAYLHEGEEHEQRVHVWHPSLRRPGIEESGLLHDHRFDLDSTVLLGGLRQVEHDVTPDPDGGWVLHEVVHAREAAARNKVGVGSFHLPPTELPARYRLETSEVIVPEGHAYTFPKRAFHGTYPLGLTVTLVEKRAQENFKARILAPLGKPLVHAFSDPLPEAAWAPVLHGAAAALRVQWSEPTAAEGTGEEGDPECSECGHVESDHRPQIDGGTCGAPAPWGRRCACRRKPASPTGQGG